MLAYTLKRILSLLPVLLVISIFVFLLVYITPGDPAAVLLGMDATPADAAALNHRLGLDKPLAERYFIWLGNLLKGDMGTSYFMQQPVSRAIAEHLGPTLMLSFIAQFIAIFTAIPSGLIAAEKRGTRLDVLLRFLSLVGTAIPGFLLGLFLMLIFAVMLQWLPVAGYVPLSRGLGEYIKYFILPGVSLGLVQSALIMRMTRSSVLDVLHQNYIKTARSKGLRENQVLLIHAFRTAALPILTVIGQSFGSLITGAVVTESLFNIPGLGQLIINAIRRRDFLVIQGVVICVTLIYTGINLVTDLLYGILDPRVRLESRRGS
ncbi:MAG: ABC transporter permease [Spirochaetaceae bacterium]|nr:ABC transporter permease [Spirochaetaceae bacterium]